MAPDVNRLQIEAQHVLDELWYEALTPFHFRVGMLTKDVDQYTIHIYDTRIYTLVVPVSSDFPFSDGVRWAVLKRAAEIAADPSRSF